MEHLYHNNIVFNNDRGKWLHYSKDRWELDESDGVIQDMAISMIRRIPSEVSHLDDDDEMKEAYRKWSHACESAGKVSSCIQLTEKAMSVPDERFDSDEFKVNLQNGTFDLKNMKMTRHNRFDYITKITPVHYDPEAQCPRWLQFLDEVFKGDKDLIAFIQRAIGYSLTGSTKEQVFFLMYGSGANGKSVFIDTINHMMGEYIKRAEFSTFVSRRTTGAPRNDIAMLNGARMVSASEGTVTTVFDDALIKQLTGDETITARFLHREFFEFTPTFKIWLASNHLPIIKDDSMGIWRRIKCIPFDVSFRGREDTNLLPKLKSEIDGIFNWAVEGYKKWEKQGLGTCKRIEETNNTYKNDMDIFGAFSDEVLEEVPNTRTPTSEIYDAYMDWNERSGHRALSKNRFGIKMREHGYEKEKVGGVIYWFNVVIKGKHDEF
jgi:putative DNA primase/helicase